MKEGEQTTVQAKGEARVEIICFIPADKERGLATGFLKYRLPFEEAKEKVRELVDKLVTGEVEGFNVYAVE